MPSSCSSASTPSKRVYARATCPEFGRDMAQQDKSDTRPEGSKPSRKRRLGLAEQVLIALVLGLAAGIFFGDMAGALKVVGEAFIMLLQVSLPSADSDAARALYQQMKDQLGFNPRANLG